jgi:integrase
MATIRKRGANWHVQIRRRGYPSINRSFKAHADAVAWGREQDRAIDRADLPCSGGELKRLTVVSILERYEASVIPQKRGADREKFKVRVLMRHAFAGTSLERVSGATIAAYRDDRLKAVAPGTVRRELALLRHCFEVARKEWRIPLRSNPVCDITLPSPAKGRDRRMSDDEARAFWLSVHRAKAWWVRPFVMLAVETGMRRGELLSAQWEDITKDGSLLRLRQTKNGYERVVPLTPVARAVLNEMQQDPGPLFPIKPFTVRQGWERIIMRAGLQDLRLHDLRHEAVSRFFEMGLTTPEVALISGHRDIRMLARYTHLRPENVAAKLAKLACS